MQVAFFMIVMSVVAVSYDCLADGLSVTVYNNDLAVIRDIRDMQFISGVQTKTMTDVPERIDPTSVRFAVEGGGVAVIEQNYRYDLVNSQKVLRRYIDNAISIRMKEGDLIEGILQSVAGDVVVSTVDGVEIVRIDAIERFSFPELPEGLITRPTLFWTLTSDRARTAPAEISYMSSGFEWHAEYTAVIGTDEKSMDMSSWVSIHNNSGAAFKNADLKLVAGEVNKVVQPRAMRKDMMLAAEQERTAGGFEERGLFEYHLYDLEGQTTLNNAEIKQIALFPETRANVKKALVFDAWKNPDGVTATVEFKNSESDGLGLPLPAGKVRVYTRDQDGSIEFVGEDRIDHTPKNEDVKLSLGTAFDIAAERKVMDTRRITDRVREETIEIELRNRKTVMTGIRIVEHFRGDWEIRKTTDNFEKKDAFTAECTVSVPADGIKTVTFTVRYQ